VLNWLEGEVGLSELASGFQARDVNGATMNELAQTDLASFAELGVESVINQAKIVGMWKRAASNHGACLRAA
jgi:hypothetical protein